MDFPESSNNSGNHLNNPLDILNRTENQPQSTMENVQDNDDGNDDEDDDNNVIAVNRRCTDILFLLLIIAFVIVLIGLLAYTMSYGDIYRIINGYDDCGNVCGRTNSPIEDLGCSGADRTNEQFLLVVPSTTESSTNSVYRSCVQNCEDRASYKEYFNRCLPVKGNDVQNLKLKIFSKTGISEFFQEVSEDFENCWIEILILCFISLVSKNWENHSRNKYKIWHRTDHLNGIKLEEGRISSKRIIELKNFVYLFLGLSLVIVFALRYIVTIIVWLMLIGVVATLISATIFLWVQYKYSLDDSNGDYENDEMITTEKRSSYLGYAIVVTIATVCICLIILALRKRIELVIELFKEAGKALIAMPLLLLEPILTFLALAFFTSFWLFFTIYIESSGIFTMENNESVRYIKDSTMMVTRWYNLLALFWFVNFVIGCQHMVIAGAVAKWFFTRNKSKLSQPILKSFQNLVRYHLGTVSIGSFLIALVNLIRVIFKLLMYALRKPKNKLFEYLQSGCQCCLYIFENFLQYITRNAYIETAITGEGFCVSGKRAFEILTKNALRVFAINSIGDFVLLLTKGIIVLVTVLIGIELIQKKEGIYHNWVPLAIAGLFAYLVAHCFISVYEMTIDTIFICFCEDCERNDGIGRPYYMSRGLMEFVQNSKKSLQIHDTRTSKAWSEEKT